MPIGLIGKRHRLGWAWRWLALVLLLHLLILWTLDQLTGRDAELRMMPRPIQVRLLQAVQSRPAPQEPEPAERAPSEPPPLPALAPNPEPPAARGIQLAEGLAGPGAGASDPSATASRPSTPPPPASAQESLPDTGTLAIQAFLGEYELGKEALGVGEIQLRFPAQDRYEIVLRARAQGWVSALVSGEVLFKSEGTLSPFGLKPQRYSQVTPFRGPTESLFDPDRGARLKPDAAWTYLPAGLQDRLSVVFQLAFIAQTRPEQFGFGQRHVISMATDRDIKPLAFTVASPEELVLPGGILVTALRVESDPFEFRRMGRIKLWLDPADRFYPVRIQYSEPSGRILDFIAIRNPLTPTS